MQSILGASTIALVAAFVSGSAGSAADAPKDLVLKLALKSDTFEYAGKGGLAQLAKDLAAAANKKGGFGRQELPPAFVFPIELVITNTGKAALTLHIKGDPNQFELTATGPSVKVVSYPVVQTTDFRLPLLTVIDAGQSIRIPVGMLEDGLRGRGRRIYLAEAGEYKLSATYKLADTEGGDAGTLKSEPVKLTVSDAK